MRHRPISVLTRRELNRATLARQLLLARSPLGVTAAIDRLAGLQAQYSPAPYVALWTRLADFARDDLTRALRRRSVVKATLMRGTLHLVTARELPSYAALVAHAGEQRFVAEAGHLGLDPAVLREAIDEHLREPRSVDELIVHLTSRGGRARRRAYIRWRLLAAHGGLIHAWPSGAWRVFGAARLVAARHVLRGWRDLDHREALAHLARRYLAAFGPASPADLTQWSGIPQARWRPGLEAIAGELRSFRDEDGRALLDLRRAPRPAAETVAPVRFLGKWDSVLLAHARRDRVLPHGRWKLVVGPNGDVLPTFLVDGTVAGSWSVTRRGEEALLTLSPFGRLDRAVRRALEDEAEPLVRFLEPDAARHGVRA